MQHLAGQNAPSPFVVVPHFAIGAAFWLVVSLLIVLFPDSLSQHFFNPKLLAMTHLLVLGFITMVIFGALYQLIPVIMEEKLHSEKLAISSLFTLTSGTIFLAYSFWNSSFNNLLFFSAFLLLLSVILFAVNVFKTGLKSVKKNTEKKFIVTSLLWLLFTVLIGVLMTLNLVFPFLKISHLEVLKLHAHVGIIGWILQLIIGVGSKLLPMFMVSHNLNEKKLKIAYYLINIGLIVGTISVFLEIGFFVNLSVIVVIIGVLSFLSFIYEAFSKRIKKKLDIGMKQTLIAFLTFVISLFLVLLIISKISIFESISIQLNISYIVFLLVGFISSLIMGQTYKTLPFIIWLKVYRNKLGKGKIPLPIELYSRNIATAQLLMFILGFFILMIGIVITENGCIRLGASFLLLSILLYNYNIYKIILHKSTIYGK